MDSWGCAQRKNSVAINLWGKKTVSFQMRAGTAAPYFQGPVLSNGDPGSWRTRMDS